MPPYKQLTYFFLSHKLADQISHIIHPLWVPSFCGAFLLFCVSTSLSAFEQWRMMTAIFFSTALVPLFALYVLRKMGYLSSLKIPDRKERPLPLSITALFLVFFGWYLVQAEVPLQLGRIFILMGVCGTLLAFFSFFYQISIHAASVGGMVCVFLWIIRDFPNLPNLFFGIAVLLLAGLVMTARLRLNAHTPFEVYSGFLLGVFCMSFLYDFPLST